MKIAIDARTIIDPRGIGYFLYNAIIALAKNNPDWQFILFSHSAINSKMNCDFKKFDNISIFIIPAFIFSKNGLFWFVFKYPRAINSLKPDIIWAPATFFPPFVKIKAVKLCTVHDLVYKNFRHIMSLKHKIISMLFMDSSINNADKLWAVSHYTATLIKKYYPQRKSKKIIEGSSINMDQYKRIKVNEKERYDLLQKLGVNLNKKILIFVGTLEPRKNIKFLLNLMVILANKDFELIIVGGKGWGKTEIKNIVEKKGYPKRAVHFAGYLGCDELLKLYNIVDCFVSTSLNEGFGLPQLEAMACKIPVVSAKNSAVEEIVGDAGVLVEGWDFNNWVEKIQWAVEHRANIIQRYDKQLQKYDWLQIAERVSGFIKS